jgi:NAD(P)-dependent dehydrogenase (short-subunit alcohol dehydrogenase family)
MDDACGASAAVQGPGSARQRSKPRPGDDADPQGVPADLGDPRVDDDIARVGRAGSAPDIAPAVLFLCSDAARWINGANLPVDGGLEASINATVLGF